MPKETAPKKTAPKKKAAARGPSLTVTPASFDDVLSEVAAGIAAAPEKWTSFELVQVAEVEASEGRAARAVELLRQAVEGGDLRAKTIAVAAQSMAKRGPDLAAPTREAIALAESIPPPAYPQPGEAAATKAHLAAAHEHLGDVPRALALVDEALALAPEWTTIPDSPYAPTIAEGDAAALAADLLLRHGKREQAYTVLQAIRAPFGVAPIFRDAAARGDQELTTLIDASYRDAAHAHEAAANAALDAEHFAVFDSVYARLATNGYYSVGTLERLAMRRLVRAAIGAKETADLRARIEAALAPHEPAPKVIAWTTAIDECRAAGLADVARALGDVLVAARIAVPPAQSFLTGHTAVAAARAGADITPILAGAETPAARLALANALFDAGIALPAAIELVVAIDPSSLAADQAAAAARTARGLADAGKDELATAFFDFASTAAGNQRFVLRDVAVEQLLASHFDGAWATIKRAKKSELGNVIADVASASGQRGRSDILGAILRAAGFATPFPILTGIRSWAYRPRG